jgi:hypothetical protein
MSKGQRFQQDQCSATHEDPNQTGIPPSPRDDCARGFSDARDHIQQAEEHAQDVSQSSPSHILNVCR